MKVLSVTVDAARATIVLRPSWLARLFGARDLLVELEFEDKIWVSRWTRARIGGFAYSDLVKSALEATPIDRSARARLLP